MSKELLTRRGQMALIGGGMWVLLAFWSISAFWEHIEMLQPSYALASKAGAMAGEFALLAFMLLHCFDKHIGVRKWSLIFSLILTGTILIHAGALRGMKEAQIAQIDTESRMALQLGKMSAEQAKAIEADQTGTQRERLAKSRAALAQKAEVAKSAQKKVADTISAGAEAVKVSSILPRWYLDGWMYSLLFMMSSLFLGCVFLMMMKDDVDANFDGIPDKHQAGFVAPASTTFTTVAQPVSKGGTDPKAPPR